MIPMIGCGRTIQRKRRGRMFTLTTFWFLTATMRLHLL